MDLVDASGNPVGRPTLPPTPQVETFAAPAGLVPVMDGTGEYVRREMFLQAHMQAVQFQQMLQAANFRGNALLKMWHAAGNEDIVYIPEEEFEGEQVAEEMKEAGVTGPGWYVTEEGEGELTGPFDTLEEARTERDKDDELEDN
jgi:hypothetical protein